MARTLDGDDLAVPAGFELVADENRARILYELSRQVRDEPEDPTLGFAELRKRAGVRDSGNFNYHLDKLLGRYVEETGDGYVLTHPGMAVVAALVGGEYEAGEELGPAPYGEPCPICGGDLSVEYGEGILALRCDGTSPHTMEYILPRHAVDADDLPAAADLMAERAYAELSQLLAGRCPLCFGETGVSLLEPPEEDLSPAFDVGCSRCGMHYNLVVGQAAIHHADVVAFYADHGIDLRSAPLALLRLAQGDLVRRVGDDPPQFELAVTLDGDRLRATIDGDGSVSSVDTG